MDINLRKVKKFYKKYKPLAFLTVIAIFIFVTALGYHFTNKVITITDGEEQFVFSVRGKITVQQVLIKEDIYLKPEDEVFPSLSEKLKDGDNVTISRAIPVTVVADGYEYKFDTTTRNVNEVISDIGIEIGEIDIVSPGKGENISEDSNIIKIVRVDEELVEEKQVIPYSTITRSNTNMDKGITKVVQKGNNGQKVVTEKVVYHDSLEFSRDIIHEEITKDSTNRVEEVGTNIFVATSRGQTKFVKAMYVTATGYCPCNICTGSYDGSRTASGAPTRAYHTIATPKTFSFGTEFFIPYFSKASNKGIFVVEDRGGAIKGNRIDVFFNTHNEALKFGRRTLKIYILD